MNTAMKDRSSPFSNSGFGAHTPHSGDVMAENSSDASPLPSVESTGSISSLKSSLSGSSRNSSFSRSLRPFKASSPGSARKRARLLPKANRRGGKNKPIVIRDLSSGGVQGQEVRKNQRKKSHLLTGPGDENCPPVPSESRSGPAETLGELRRVLESLLNQDFNTERKRAKGLFHESNHSAQDHFVEELPWHYDQSIHHDYSVFEPDCTCDPSFKTSGPIPTVHRKRLCATPGTPGKELPSPKFCTSVLSLDRVNLNAKWTKDLEKRPKEIIKLDLYAPFWDILENGPECLPTSHEELHQAEAFSLSGPSELKGQANFIGSHDQQPKKHLRHRHKTPQLSYSDVPTDSFYDRNALASSAILAQTSAAFRPRFVNIAEGSYKGQKLVELFDSVNLAPANDYCGNNNGAAPPVPCELTVKEKRVKQKRHFFARSLDMEAGGVTWDASSFFSPSISGELEAQSSGQSAEMTVETKRLISRFDPILAVTLLLKMVTYPLALVWKIAYGL
ncbi:hypothetical protein A7U60_g2679 [Sanghuangporus baumii]|uniref:Uncharacterized protein n=1 Tax=Sanghuangporus baumii TaxID=108892 RepID=A0A9Q5N7T8_SANBA|nr:hypothetical protein A7U60_g2679 [Sanghuangporus baumii]